MRQTNGDIKKFDSDNRFGNIFVILIAYLSTDGYQCDDCRYTYINLIMISNNQNNTTLSTPLSPLQTEIIEAVLNRKGKKITVIDFGSLETAPARSFIVCEGSSTSQVGAIADNIREEVREKLGVKPYNYDGYRNSQWIVIDYGEVIVHVFVPEFRNYYNLEDLWSDAKINALPDLD